LQGEFTVGARLLNHTVDANGAHLDIFGIPVSDNTRTNQRWSLDLDGFGRFFDDAQYSLVHYDYGAELAFVGGFRTTRNMDLTTKRLNLLIHIGYAEVDSPVFVGPNFVAPGPGGNPEFQKHGALDSGVELHIPFFPNTKALLDPLVNSGNGNGSISIGFVYDVFQNNLPNQWSAYIAWSANLGGSNKSKQ
jgi:hypothetical protein